MRHKVYGAHLNRDKNQRTALFRSLVRSLILSEKIQTTDAKAKAVKGIVDKLVNQAKSPSTRRLISQFITDKKVVEKLTSDIAPRLANRTSGYTSIVKLGKRLGDGATLVQMSLLTENKKTEAKSANKETKVAASPKIEAKTDKPKPATRKTKE